MAFVTQPLSWPASLDYESNSVAFLQLSEREGKKSKRDESLQKNKYSGLHVAQTCLPEIVLCSGACLYFVEKEAYHNLNPASLGTDDSESLAIWGCPTPSKEVINRAIIMVITFV